MARLADQGMAVELPPGWDGAIGEAVGERRPVAHLANFPLPAERGDFGSGAVEVMRAGDVLVVLFEHDPASSTTALFSHSGVPRVAAGDFDRDALHRGLPGQSGLQRFFNHQGRAFCLYVVAGSHLDRADVVPVVNRVLASLEVE